MKLLDIARRLTEYGVPTATGKPWSKPVLAEMLRNTTYVGEARGNRRMVAEPETRRKPAVAGKSKKTSMRTRPRSEWIIVKVPAIIDHALFDRVQARLDRDRHINSGRPSTNILRGLIKCGACGHACCVFPNHGKPRYRCNNIDRLTYQRKCKQPSVSVAAIENAVWNEVMFTFEDPARVWELMTGQWEALAKTDKQIARERAELSRSIEQLKRREFRAAQALLDADVRDSAATFREDLKRTQAQRRAQEARPREIAARPAPRVRFGQVLQDGGRLAQADGPRTEA